MTKVLTFQVGIEGLEDKIWRKIESILKLVSMN